MSSRINFCSSWLSYEYILQEEETKIKELPVI
jgi:hypothetical protein